MNVFLLKNSIRSRSKLDFSRSGGPGGQNVNKVNTKVTLHIRLDDLEGLSEIELIRLRTVLSNRITVENEIIVSSDEERSQHINRERAYARLESIVIASARLPRSRRPTKPSKAVKEKRLNSKHRLRLKKENRRFNPEE